VPCLPNLVVPRLDSPASLARQRAAAAVLAVWIALVAVEAAPHLVHHLFDDDQAPPCEFLALADHAPGLLAASPDLPVLADATERPTLRAQSALPGVFSSPFGPRAPPEPRPSLVLA
jgi:hypothetical protein